MRNVKKLLGLGAVAAAVTLGGCAPGFHFGGSPQVGFRGGCSQITHQAYRTTSIFQTRQKVAAIQSRFSLGARYAPASTQGWKSIASGECRY